MKNQYYLESFLSAIDSQKTPDKQTLESIAASLRKMQEGSSFESAFISPGKRGRKLTRKPIRRRSLNEVNKYVDGIKEYYKLIDSGISHVDAKDKTCKMLGICARDFDDYRACFNKIKKYRGKSTLPLLFQPSSWVESCIINERLKELLGNIEQRIDNVQLQFKGQKVKDDVAKQSTQEIKK